MSGCFLSPALGPERVSKAEILRAIWVSRAHMDEEEERDMKNANKILTFLTTTVLLVILFPLIGYAAVPQQITYQGALTDTTGYAVPDGDYVMTFALYDVPTGGTALWSEAQTVAVSNGIYNVILGQAGNELDPVYFNGDCYLGVTVGTDSEMSPRQKLTSVGYALRAQVAESVAAGTVSTIMIQDAAVDSAKLADSAVTESKIGDATVTAEKIQDGAALAEISDNDGEGSGLDADKLDGLDASSFASAAYVSSLESRIADLETQMAGLVALLQSVTRVGNEITFSGVNVHVVNGTGTTDGTVNGLGNLIVGYNELRGTGDVRTGSHNIVVGQGNNYSSYGGLVAGKNNAVTAEYSSVSGGFWNTASGAASSVSGGTYNTAIGGFASVSGGNHNTASHNSASVSGGSYNTASAANSSVSGGADNTASGSAASVGGGSQNTASGVGASVSGGRHNIASGERSFAGGGGGENTADGNEAFANYSSILGGITNETGDKQSDDHTIGTHSTVSGGYYNTASGSSASVSGGSYNTASGVVASISGGYSNTASGSLSSVSSGESNTASGSYSNVSGGYYNTASETYSSVSGGYSNTASGVAASVSGGRNNIASGKSSFVGGGGGEDVNRGNEAFADYSSILGGYQNATGDKPSGDHTIGTQATVSGGYYNTASGSYSSVSGGSVNTASGYSSSVSGGNSNTASHYYASVSGGYLNDASADFASVSGGRVRGARDIYDWRAGNLLEDQ